jgi:hypothetical protein
MPKKSRLRVAQLAQNSQVYIPFLDSSMSGSSAHRSALCPGCPHLSSPLVFISKGGVVVEALLDRKFVVKLGIPR